MTPIERVARAVVDAIMAQSNLGDGQWEASRRSATVLGYIDFDEYDVTDLARAAIEAMREPTEAMHQAAHEATSAAYMDTCSYLVAWPAVIEAALKERP